MKVVQLSSLYRWESWDTYRLTNVFGKLRESWLNWDPNTVLDLEPKPLTIMWVIPSFSYTIKSIPWKRCIQSLCNYMFACFQFLSKFFSSAQTLLWIFFTSIFLILEDFVWRTFETVHLSIKKQKKLSASTYLGMRWTCFPKGYSHINRKHTHTWLCLLLIFIFTFYYNV